MNRPRRRLSSICCLFAMVTAGCVLWPLATAAQGLTGALMGTLKDEQGGALPGARVRVSSPALIGGAEARTTDDKGHLRFPVLAPGLYALDIDLQGFASYHEADISIGAGATLERTLVLKVAGVNETVVVQGNDSRIDARNSGFETRFGPARLGAIPTRRLSMFEPIRAAPGISPTSPASSTVTTVSAFGSGTNENQFLFDGTNFTCPCNGVARAEPGVDFIQEVHVQSVGASAEFGNVQGAVINVITRSGSNMVQFDASYYGQPASLTSQPVLRPLAAPATGQSGYGRARYRDLTSNLGGPVVRDRVWFFGGYQYLRDHDSQPGTDPNFPRTYEQNKVFAKLTWKLAQGWQLVQSFHEEFWVSPESPTFVTPPEATVRRSGSVPATTFGHLTHSASANTVWDVRVGRFVFSQDNSPTSGNRTTASRFDSGTSVTSFAPPLFGTLTIMRTTAKATVSHYRAGLLGANHELKVGLQVEKAGHHAVNVIPSGARFNDRNGLPDQKISADPSNIGGQFITTSAFASDAIRVGNRLTINAGLRFDHHRAISQDLPAVDLLGRETQTIIPGLGTLYTWNLWSPRLGVTAKLSADGRAILRASYGRFSQGVLTGELEPFHPGGTTTATAAFENATGSYTRIVSVVNPRDLQINREMRAPHTDEFSIGVDREAGRRIAVAVAYVHKDGANFIGWTDVGGQYAETTALLQDGRSVPVFRLVNKPGDRRFLLTNPEGYSMRYNGLVTVVEKRRSDGWQASGSYTFSRVYGLQPSSGTTAAGAQVSTVSPPQPLTFGRDPNDLINARGRLPNDRPHIFRVSGSVDVPRTGLVLAASLQSFSGKPWAATALINPQDSQRRVLLEPRGSRRLSSQTLLDLRVSRTIRTGGLGRIGLFLDVLNALNDTAEESLATDVLASAAFGQPTVFMDPRRVMVGVRLNLGR